MKKMKNLKELLLRYLRLEKIFIMIIFLILIHMIQNFMKYYQLLLLNVMKTTPKVLWINLKKKKKK